MGGGGGDFFPKPRKLETLIGQAQDTAEQQKLDSNVNDLLNAILAKANQRAPEKTKEYLNKLRKIVSSDVEVEQLLLAGSVAKNTYVDELSDIDALAILDRADLAGKSPKEVLSEFCRSLKSSLTTDVVKNVAKGKMAVTVTYVDGTEIQMLPALRSGDRVLVPRSDASGWNETRPQRFQSTLSKANEKVDGALIPTIKLVKKIVAGLPEQRQLTGYHCEALGLNAVKDYHGPKTCKAMLMHILDSASKRVMHPIQDVTGQSRVVDDYLGGAESIKRRVAADALAGVARRLKAATTVNQWKRIIEGPK